MEKAGTRLSEAGPIEIVTPLNEKNRDDLSVTSIRFSLVKKTDLFSSNILVAGHYPAQDLLPVEGVVAILVQLNVEPESDNSNPFHLPVPFLRFVTEQLHGIIINKISTGVICWKKTHEQTDNKPKEEPGLKQVSDKIILA